MSATKLKVSTVGWKAWTTGWKALTTGWKALTTGSKASITSWTRSTVRYLFNAYPMVPRAQTASQGIISGIAFYDGFCLQIHPSIITLHPKLITSVRLNGSFKAVYSASGSPLTVSCGYTGNVCYFVLHHATTPDRFLFLWRVRGKVSSGSPFILFRLRKTDIINSAPRSYKISWS